MFMSSFKGIYWWSSWKASHRQEQKWSGLAWTEFGHMIFRIQAWLWLNSFHLLDIGCNRYAALATGRYYYSERTSFAAHQHYGGKSWCVRMLSNLDTCRDLTNVQLPNTHPKLSSFVQSERLPSSALDTLTCRGPSQSDGVTGFSGAFHRRIRS